MNLAVLFVLVSLTFPLVFIGMQRLSLRRLYAWMAAAGFSAGILGFLLVFPFGWVGFAPFEAAVRLGWAASPAAYQLLIAHSAVFFACILAIASSDSLPGPRYWAVFFMAFALGVVGVLPANFFTLLIAWIAIDLFSLIYAMAFSPTERTPDLFLAYGTRFVGVIVVLFAVVLQRITPNFETSSFMPVVSNTLFFGLGLRVFPGEPLFANRSHGAYRILDYWVRVLPAISVVLLLTAQTQLFRNVSGIVLGLFVFGLIWGAFQWAFSVEYPGRREGWVRTCFSLSGLSALIGVEGGIVVWAILGLVGGQLLWVSENHSLWRWFGLLGLFFVVVLLFSPPFPVEIMGQSGLWVGVYSLGVALLGLGLVRELTLGQKEAAPGVIGVRVLLGFSLFAAVFAFAYPLFLGGYPLAVLETWRFALPGFSLFFVFWLINEYWIPKRIRAQPGLPGLDILASLVGKVYHSMGFVVNLTSTTLEGSAGILWMLLLLLFLIFALSGIIPG